jgi:hypothetical protein
MNVQVATLTAAVLMFTSGSAQAEADGPPAAPTMIVRTYLQNGVSGDDLRTARAYAESAFHLAGVTLVWVDCNGAIYPSVGATAACSGPMMPNEIILRLRAAYDTDGPALALGASLVNTQSGGSPPLFSTVFCDRVRSIARAAGVDQRRVLGYAIAHELGHLLLDTPRHPDSGLMRAFWSRVELRRNGGADWQFHPAEAAAIRCAVATRHNKVRDAVTYRTH